MSQSDHWRPSGRSSPIGWVLFVVAIVLVVVRGLDAVGDGRSDFMGYLKVGELVLSDGDIYADSQPGLNTWPPVFSILSVPLAAVARIDERLAGWVWLVFGLGFLYGAWALTVRLVYHRPLLLRDHAGAVCVASAAALGPLLLTVRHVLRNFGFLQINILILLLTLWGLTRIVDGRRISGGALIGLAAGIKVVPVLFLPYFVYKRWWRALVGATSAGILITLSPALIFGPRQTWLYMHSWYEALQTPYARTIHKGNQSLLAMVDRFAGPGVTPWRAELDLLTQSGDPVVIGVVCGLALAGIAAFLFATRRGGLDPSGAEVTTECALVFVAILLLVPLSWSHYFVYLLPANAVLWRAALASTRSAAPVAGKPIDPYSLQPADRVAVRWLLGLSFLLVLLTVPALLGNQLAWTMKQLSVITMSALVVAAALLLVRVRLGRDAAPSWTTPRGGP